jgi:hypothetical protein
MFRKRLPVQQSHRSYRDAIALDPCIEPVGGRTAGGAEELVKAVRQRTVGNRAGEIRLFDRVHPKAYNWFAIVVEEREPDMPFSRKHGVVSPIPQHARQGEPAIFDKAGSFHSGKNTALVSRAEGHAPGEQAVS